MSKRESYLYSGTKGHIVSVASTLPTSPDLLLTDGWTEVTDSRAAKSNTRVFTENSTGLRIRFDKGVSGEHGFRGTDHYHIDNPNATGKLDQYLDVNGNPVPRGSRKSHILPEGGN